MAKMSKEEQSNKDFMKEIEELVKNVKIKSSLGRGPKIKNCESMVFDHTPPPNLNYGLFT